MSLQLLQTANGRKRTVQPILGADIGIGFCQSCIARWTAAVPSTVQSYNWRVERNGRQSAEYRLHPGGQSRLRRTRLLRWRSHARRGHAADRLTRPGQDAPSEL